MNNTANIPASKYLPFFKEQGKALPLVMTGDILLVERIKFPEARTKSGIIIESDIAAARTMNGIGADKPSFYRVLHTGAGFYDDTTNEDVPLDTKTGDIVLVGAVSVKLFSLFPLQECYDSDSIGITRESDIQIRFSGEDQFIEFLRNFNEATKAQVARNTTS